VGIQDRGYKIGSAVLRLPGFGVEFASGPQQRPGGRVEGRQSAHRGYAMARALKPSLGHSKGRTEHWK